jgi:protein required for attachment to host cells
MRLWLFYDLFVRISSNALLTAKFVLFPTKQRYDFRVSTDSDILNKQHKRGARLAHRERERERKDRLREREQKLAHERRYIKR